MLVSSQLVGWAPGPLRAGDLQDEATTLRESIAAAAQEVRSVAEKKLMADS